MSEQEKKQGEPVTLPARMAPSSHFAQQRDWKWSEGWNACLDEIAKLGPLYAHSEPAQVEEIKRHNAELMGEVDTLRDEAHQDGLLRVRYGSEIDTLRAQLAEAHSLLREIHDGSLSGYQRFVKIDAALSASAEPSAPVERDGRAAFEAHFPVPKGVRFDPSDNSYFDDRWFDDDGGTYQPAWEGWQARATLERKP